MPLSDLFSKAPKPSRTLGRQASTSQGPANQSSAWEGKNSRLIPTEKYKPIDPILLSDAPAAPASLAVPGTHAKISLYRPLDFDTFEIRLLRPYRRKSSKSGGSRVTA